jgi:hypothetical protein
MRKLILWCGSFVLCAFASVQAAPILAIQGPGSFATGGSASFDLVISGLDGTQQVGAFDFSLSWDPAVLSLSGSAFDVFLDGPGFSLQSSLAGVGTINLAETSFGPLAAQSGLSSFRLASLTFAGIAPGTSSLAFTPGVFSDGLGELLGVEYRGSRTTVTPRVSVSEPSTLSLLAMVALALAWSARRRRLLASL